MRIHQTRIKKLINIFLYYAAISLSIFLLFFVSTSTWIGYEVKSACRNAQREYGQSDCIRALIRLLNDKEQGFRARNTAIWALGQLGDKSALPTLEKYYTGNIPKREALDKTISQYELTKAIRLARGGANITRFLWK